MVEAGRLDAARAGFGAPPSPATTAPMIDASVIADRYDEDADGADLAEDEQY